MGQQPDNDPSPVGKGWPRGRLRAAPGSGACVSGSHLLASFQACKHGPVDTLAGGTRHPMGHHRGWHPHSVHIHDAVPGIYAQHDSGLRRLYASLQPLWVATDSGCVLRSRRQHRLALVFTGDIAPARVCSLAVSVLGDREPQGDLTLSDSVFARRAPRCVSCRSDLESESPRGDWLWIC